MQTTSYKLNVTPGGVPLTIHISQYDVGLRQYTFQPYTTVGEFSYVSGATVTLEATKPDGYAVIHECDYNQDGSITYTVQAQLAAKPGRVWSKVVIRDGSDVLGTGAIIWVVDYAGVKDNAIISDSDISALQQWMDDVEDYAEQADGSAQAAASAVSLAESAAASAQEAATQAAGYVDQAVILGGTPLVAATVSAMTNHDRVYVYTGSETGYTAGNWYYWNGSAWTSGGIYNSSAVQTDPTLSVSGMAADAAATGELKNETTDIIGINIEKEGTFKNTGTGATVWSVNVGLVPKNNMYVSIFDADGIDVPSTSEVATFFVVYNDSTQSQTDVAGIKTWYKLNWDTSKTVTQVNIRYRRSASNLSSAVESKWSYVAIDKEPLGHTLDRLNTESVLLHNFGVGHITGAINFDTTNQIISIPAGHFYQTATTSNRDIPAATIDYSGASVFNVICIDWANRVYVSIPYSTYRSLSAKDYIAIATYRKANPEDASSPYQITIDGYSHVSINQLGIPVYWQSELDSVIDDVALLQTYENGVTFGFITDIHWENNFRKSPALIKYIADNSRVDMWINGGDTASGDNGDGTTQKKTLYEAIGKYNGDFEFYSINGNHDSNAVGGQTTLTSAEIKNLIMPYENNVTFGDGNYYWFDYRGTRFVCLDTGTNGATDSTQISWASNVIQNSTLPVIIVMHIIKVNYADTNPCAFFNDLITAIGANTDGKVKMIIAGHAHHDFTMTASNGIPVIALDTDSKFADDGITRVSGTTKEQCLSIVTIDYDAETIHVNRVGSIGSDITVNY